MYSSQQIRLRRARSANDEAAVVRKRTVGCKVAVIMGFTICSVDEP